MYSLALAAIATIIALIGTMPYIVLQLKAVTSTFTLLTTPSDTAGSWIAKRKLKDITQNAAGQSGVM